jgi:hypothetical protein
MRAALPTLVGFGLGQFVNLVALRWRLWVGPTSKIRSSGQGGCEIACYQVRSATYLRPESAGDPGQTGLE